MKLRLGTFMCAAVLVTAGAGCGDDDGGGTAGTGGSTAGTGGGAAGTGGGAAGTGGGLVDNTPIQGICPGIAPLDGPYAQKETCCYRTSNNLRNQDAETMTLEYRLQHNRTVTQPETLGTPLVISSSGTSFESYGWMTLFRYEGVPAEGEGAVTVTLGPGVYNCDGTFSFLKDAGFDASQDHGGRTGEDRWDAITVSGTWNWDWPEKFRADPADSPKLPRLSPIYLAPDAEGVAAFGYELPQSQLMPLNLPITPEQLDCVGERTGESHTAWESDVAQQVSYMDVAAAHRSRIPSQGFSLGQLVAFNLLNEVEAAELSPVTTPRNHERWVHLPDALCPTSDTDNFLCHAGTGDECSETAPESLDDPGQCCDPMGESETLPECNAWRTISHMVLGAVEITDTTSTTPYRACN